MRLIHLSFVLADVLLCHDDKCVDRCVAFVLYLTGTGEEKGGAFEMFGKDGKLNKIFPNKIFFGEPLEDSIYFKYDCNVSENSLKIIKYLVKVI